MFDDFEIKERGFSDDGEDIMTREYTTKLIELVEDGTIDPQSALENLVNWLSERDVKSFFEDEYSEYDSEQSSGGVYQEASRSYCLECGEDFEWFMHNCDGGNDYNEIHGCPSCDDNCGFCKD